MNELKFWLERVDGLNSRDCKPGIAPVAISIMGDESASGCGSFIEGTDIIAARSFSSKEREAHSTWRELENVHFSLKALKPYIEGRTVRFHVNNQATVNIVAKGSMRPGCHQFAIEIFEFCPSLQWE